MRAPRRLRTLLLAAVLTAGLGGCGNKHDTTDAGETEAAYLDLGGLRYQVQISRQLNPSDNEDQFYLRGLEPEEAKLAPDQVWFGVFVLVQNENDAPREAADHFEIADTQENVFEPVELDPQINEFAYFPGPVPGHGHLPNFDTPADRTPDVGGRLVLFKLKYGTLDNRPLELEIKSSQSPGSVARVDLDV